MLLLQLFQRRMFLLGNISNSGLNVQVSLDELVYVVNCFILLANLQENPHLPNIATCMYCSLYDLISLSTCANLPVMYKVFTLHAPILVSDFAERNGSFRIPSSGDRLSSRPFI